MVGVWFAPWQFASSQFGGAWSARGFDREHEAVADFRDRLPGAALYINGIHRVLPGNPPSTDCTRL